MYRFFIILITFFLVGCFSQESAIESNKVQDLSIKNGRLLVLTNVGSEFGEVFFEEFKNTLESSISSCVRGVHVHRIKDLGSSPDKIAKEISSFNPDYILSVNINDEAGIYSNPLRVEYNVSLFDARNVESYWRASIDFHRGYFTSPKGHILADDLVRSILRDEVFEICPGGYELSDDGGEIVSNSTERPLIKRQVRKVAGIRPKIMRRLEAVGYISDPKAQTTENIADVSQEMMELYRECKASCNSVEYAQINKQLGYIHFLMNDYIKAESFYRNSTIFTHNIPISLELESYSALIQLSSLLNNTNYIDFYAKKFVELSYGFGSIETGLGDALVLERFQLDLAEKNLNKAIGVVENHDLIPPLEWLELLKGIRNKLGLDAQGISKKIQRDNNVSSDVLPILKVAPVYPREAYLKRIEGFCTLIYTVTKHGRTKNIKEYECEHKVFLKPSIEAVKKFRYKPKIVDGEAVDHPGLRNRFTFQLTREG